MKPKQLRATRKAYKEFKLKVFRNHIYQHICTKKYKFHMKYNNEKKRKKVLKKAEKILKETPTPRSKKDDK